MDERSRARALPGIAQMAMKAAERTDKPVYIVPLVWKYRFVGDVSHRIHREMRIIEDGIGLARTTSTSVPLRFAALQMNILAMRMKRFGYEGGTLLDGGFERQRSFQSAPHRRPRAAPPNWRRRAFGQAHRAHHAHDSQRALLGDWVEACRIEGEHGDGR